MISKVLTHIAVISLLFSAWVASSQETGQPQQPAAGPPVSYSSVSQLNALLAQLEQAAQATTVDLAKMRVERWKTDSGNKRQTQANVESVSRNLQNALPEIINQLRASPEDLNATFKLYRNLDALFDVLGSLVESAGAFGSKDEFQSLANDLTAFERSRRSLAERMDNLTASKEAELNRLRAQVKAQAPVVTAPKKVVVDDAEPAKKPAAKKKPKPNKPPTTPATQEQPPSQPH